MFFDSWIGIVRVVVVGGLAYVALVFLLRISGKRTLSKMNAFDMVVTIALGSTLATVILSKSVALIEGVLAFALLIFLQFAVTWASVRSSKIQRLVKDEPKLLVYEGKFLRGAMEAERVTESEVRAAAREKGIAAMGKVGAAVLETDGTVSVMPCSSLGSESALSNVAEQPSQKRW